MSRLPLFHNSWDISDYGDCSESCNGTKTRSVTCVEVNNGSTSVVDDNLCVTNVGTKPDTVTDCNVNVCPYWVAEDFENVRKDSLCFKNYDMVFQNLPNERKWKGKHNTTFT